MHDYGIGGAALAGLTVYDGASRGSGRSSEMVRALAERSVVICATMREMHQYQSLIRELRPDLTTYRLVVMRDFDGMAFPEPLDLTRPVVLTHEAWRRLYERAIERVRRDVEMIVRQAFERTAAENSGPATVQPIVKRR